VMSASLGRSFPGGRAGTGLARTHFVGWAAPEALTGQCRYMLHTGLLEGLNNEIKVIKRMAYGVRIPRRPRLRGWLLRGRERRVQMQFAAMRQRFYDDLWSRAGLGSTEVTAVNPLAHRLVCRLKLRTPKVTLRTVSGPGLHHHCLVQNRSRDVDVRALIHDYVFSRPKAGKTEPARLDPV